MVTSARCSCELGPEAALSCELGGMLTLEKTCGSSSDFVNVETLNERESSSHEVLCV